MKKIKIISIISILIIILGITITKYLYKKNKIKITLSNDTIEVYKDIEIKDIINENINILNNQKIDTTKIGKQQIKIKYKNKIWRYVETINIEIKDTEKPTILIGNVIIEQGNDIDLVNNFLCGDNYDEKPKCHIEGTYNPNEIGTYKLKYIAEDSSKNKTEKEFILDVIEKQENKTQPEETYIPFEEILNKHKTENTKIGIDVSRWQGEINFEKIKNAGSEFVIIKAGGSERDGEIYEDSYFKTNIENAIKNNLEVGIYFYSNARSIKQVQDEIKYVLDLIKNYDIQIGIAFDWEEFQEFNGYNINLHTLNEMAKTFLETVKEKGYNPILYSSQYYLENIWKLEEYDTWIARYADTNTYEKEYIMWQLCSDGKIDGINGYVDIDVLYK